MAWHHNFPDSEPAHPRVMFVIPILALAFYSVGGLVLIGWLALLLLLPFVFLHKKTPQPPIVIDDTSDPSIPMPRSFSLLRSSSLSSTLPSGKSVTSPLQSGRTRI